MLRGFAASANVGDGPFPGSKFTSHTHQGLYVVDMWTTTPSTDWSVGMTTIYRDKVALWAMQYGGRYDYAVIGFLRDCLHSAYIEKAFNGGRGPSFIEAEHLNGSNGFRYYNVWHGDFDDFIGRETILWLTDAPAGYHWYRGGSLTKSDLKPDAFPGFPGDELELGASMRLQQLKAEHGCA